MDFIANVWENIWVLVLGFVAGTIMSPITNKVLTFLWNKLLRNVDQMEKRHL